MAGSNLRVSLAIGLTLLTTASIAFVSAGPARAQGFVTEEQLRDVLEEYRILRDARQRIREYDENIRGNYHRPVPPVYVAPVERPPLVASPVLPTPQSPQPGTIGWWTQMQTGRGRYARPMPQPARRGAEGYPATVSPDGASPNSASAAADPAAISLPRHSSSGYLFQGTSNTHLKVIEQTLGGMGAAGGGSSPSLSGSSQLGGLSSTAPPSSYQPSASSIEAEQRSGRSRKAADERRALAAVGYDKEQIALLVALQEGELPENVRDAFRRLHRQELRKLIAAWIDENGSRQAMPEEAFQERYHQAAVLAQRQLLTRLGLDRSGEPLSRQEPSSDSTGESTTPPPAENPLHELGQQLQQSYLAGFGSKTSVAFGHVALNDYANARRQLIRYNDRLRQQGQTASAEDAPEAPGEPSSLRGGSAPGR